MGKDVKWDELGGNSQQQSGSIFMKLEDGSNHVRLVGNPYKFMQHYKPVSARCPGEGCPICDGGEKSKVRYVVNVLDRKDGNKLKVLELGTQVVNQIASIAQELEINPGHKNSVDFIIKREGKGLNTKYTVIPKDKKQFTEEEAELIKKNMYDLEEIKKPESSESISKRMNEDGGSDSSAKGSSDSDSDIW
jgi:hypothetical protein